MKEYNFLAFDIGATSGRAVLGTLKDAKFEMKEIHRFPNPMVELHGRFYWDIYHLYTSLIESLTICARQRIRLHSIGIDNGEWILGMWLWMALYWAYLVLTEILIRTALPRTFSNGFPRKRSISGQVFK